MLFRSPSAAPSGGGRKLVLKGKRKLTVRTATHLEPPVEEGDSEMSAEEESAAYAAQNRRPRLKTLRERRALVEADGSEEAPKDNVGAKIALFVGGIFGVIVVVGLLLFWFVQSGESDAREKRSAAVQKTQDDVRASFTKTREFALKAQTDLDVAASEAEQACAKQTKEMRQVLSGRYTERVLDLLRPAPTKELRDAIASTNTAPEIGRAHV